MQIKIKADAFDKTIEMTLSNETLNNENFVDIIIDDNEYTVSVEDLYRAISLFNSIRLDNKDY